MNKLSLVALLVAISLGLRPAVGFADPEPTQPPVPTRHPVAGWVYELTYDVNTGKVISLIAYDGNGPPFYGDRRGRTATASEPGQVVLDISGDPRLSGVMADVDAYYVDVSTHQLREKAGIPISKADSLRLDYVLSLALFAAAAATILRVRRLKARGDQ